MASLEAAHEVSTPKSSSVVILADTKREVLSHQFEIQGKVETILNSIKNGDILEIERNFRSVQANIAGFEKYLSLTIETKYYNEYRKPGNTAAARVFAIPELLFAILQNLDIVELMNCYDVNRLCRDTIERSEKLQVKLFLRAKQAGSPFQILPLKLAHLECVPIYRTQHRRGLNMTLRCCVNPKVQLPRVGSRWRSMLVSHPPTYTMYVTIEEDDFGFDSDEEPGCIEGSPITTGDLSDEAERRLGGLNKNSLPVGRDGRVVVEFAGITGK